VVFSQRIAKINGLMLMMFIRAQNAKDVFMGGDDDLHFRFLCPTWPSFPFGFE